MLIALDYDMTYSADPDGWDAVVAMMRLRGHEFVCVTGRAWPPGTHDRCESVPPMPIVCSPLGYKSKAARKAGYVVDVWIDDCPGMIEEGRVVEWADDAMANADLGVKSDG